MSKSKRKHGSELEHLRGEIRRLKAQLKHYKRRHQHEEPEEYVDDAPENQCDHCGKGVITCIDLKFVKIFRCSICNYELKERIK